ncbi:YjbH domain-containing protein [Aliidiomarina soli]|nr:YjbH domain-containing protein [Aliidiomarina soli]
MGYLLTTPRMVGTLLTLAVVNLAGGFQPAHADEGSEERREGSTSQQVTVHVIPLEQKGLGQERPGQEGFEFSWEQPIRLRHVMTHALSNAQQLGQIDDVYWPAARLVDTTGRSELLERQQTAADQLGQLASYWEHRGHAKRTELAQALREQVLGWRLGYQPFPELDFERSRQTIDANPLLHPGRYQLMLPQRPRNVAVYGASSGHHLPFVSGQTVRGYMQALADNDHLLAGHDREHVIAIGVSAENRVLPWSYFNAAGDELRAGELLWVSPDSGLFPRKYRELETELTSLLKHWIGDNSNGTNIDSDDERLNDTTQSSRFDQLMQPPGYSNWERQDLTPTRNHYGGVGLLQTSTARMAPEGETVLMYADMQEYRRYTVSMQVLSWLEASAFYTRIPNRLYSPNPDFSGDSVLTDKGFDIKFRLREESYWFPALALGLRDFAGTGLFDGEYLVANKRFGAFDFSLGLGFGREGARNTIDNPFCELRDSFCSRPNQTSGTGSQLEFDRYFKGPASLFGGVEYQTPWDPLRIKVEYNGNDYSRDQAGVRIDASNPWNFGVSYRPYDWLDTQFSYERGDTFMFNVVLRTNFNTMRQVRVEEPRVSPDEERPASLDEVDWADVSWRFRRHGTLSDPRILVSGDDTVRVSSHPGRYRDPNELLDRSARILADEMPESVEHYEFELKAANQPVLLAQVDAEPFRRRIMNEDADKSPDETAELFTRSTPEMELDDYEWAHNFERSNRIGYGLNPFFKQDFGAPETFHFYQLGVKAFAATWLTDNINVFGEMGINIANNYDKFNFERDPFDLPLPRVRTDFRLHSNNDAWVDSLQLTYFKRLTENTYGAVYGGYLERFFSGVGAEWLYRRVDSPWAFGFNINRVRQRDYEGWFDHLEYETTTGHVSLVYQMPWLEDSMLRLDVGRFLAGDDGVGITFNRRFDSGVVVAAYASFTNVSSEDYGEGSFTHGFSISIPFDLIGVRPTRQRVSVSWSPMSRDGGQPLWRRTDLVGYTDDRNPFYHR